MTKTEFYNSVAKLTKACGQGLELKLARRIPGFTMDMLNEMIDEGLLKMVKHPFSYFDDSDWICLTGIYCVEEDRDNYFFMRYYMGFEDDMVKNLAAKVGKTIEDLVAERIDDYKKFLNKNLEGLEAIKRINTDIQLDESLSDETRSFLMERTWYKNNDDIESALTKCEEANITDNKRISLLNELIPLLKQVNDEDLEKREKELEKSQRDLKLRTRLVSVMTNCKDKSIKVQEVFGE